MTIVLSSDTKKPSEVGELICESWERSSLLDPAQRFLDRSGKKIRKTVVDLAYAMAGGRGAAPACLGDSIEWLHSGSLVIDDIQDASSMRREQPALHVEIGMPLALNAGNWMYFQSLDKLFDKSLSPSTQLRLLHLLIATGLRCHRGQSLDLAVRVDRVHPASLRILVCKISRLKTGSLVAMAAAFGGVAAGANKTLQKALSRFGMNVGIALQMRNDLEELRTLVSDSIAGRPLRTDDLRNARITWPWAWALKQCSPDQFERLVDQLRSSKGDPSALLRLAAQLLELTGSLGDHVIRDRIERSFRLDGEHVVDAESIKLMRSALDRISNPRSTSSTEAADVNNA